MEVTIKNPTTISAGAVAKEEKEKSDANESEGGTDGEFAEVESAAKS